MSNSIDNALIISDFLVEVFPSVGFVVGTSKDTESVKITWCDSIDANSVLKKITELSERVDGLSLYNLEMTRHFSREGCFYLIETLKKDYGITSDMVDIYDIDGDNVYYSLSIKVPDFNIVTSETKEKRVQKSLTFIESKINHVMRYSRLKEI